MCLICIDFARGALKLQEARRALGEMRSGLPPEHARDVEKTLDEAEREARDAAARSTP
ncbi:hypothetical protein [Sorangium sp. So ce1078]|uniref:hypothetical protein n=1 Tax=Sorangium sp. So ce1078 TaxID=3133329 RepID=UPI003F6390C7